MNEFIFLILGLAIGSAATFFFQKFKVQKLEMILDGLKNTEFKLTQVSNEREELLKRVSSLEADLSNAEKNLLNSQKDNSFKAETLKQVLKEVTNEALVTQNVELAKSQQNTLAETLKPFQDRLLELQGKIDLNQNNSIETNTTLLAQIKNLTDLNTKVTEATFNLTNALRSDSKKQGMWGETVLELILERSGLRKGYEYFIQETSTNSDGVMIRPDVLIKLPEDKNLIVDSKVSISAFETYVNTSEGPEKEIALKAHLQSLRNHIKSLSEKHYSTGKNLNSPEVILMFVPLESSFAVSFESDRDLFNFAWERRIVLVSPSTLLATLITVSSVWKSEYQNKNSIEIAKQSADFIDKLVGFTEDLIDIGRHLDKAKDTQVNAISKLSQGTGNLIRRATKLKELGVKSTKHFKPELGDGLND